MTEQLRPLLAPGDERLRSEIESILLVAGGPVNVAELAGATGVDRHTVNAALSELATSLRGGIRLQIHEAQVQLVTAPENIDAVQRYLGTAKPPGLSRAALETLAVVAYRQPVTRPEIEASRGVNSDRAVQTLLARGLIEEQGQRDAPGRPMQYGTGFAFLEYFGLQSLNDLPPLREGEVEAVDATKIGLRGSASDES